MCELHNYMHCMGAQVQDVIVYLMSKAIQGHNMRILLNQETPSFAAIASSICDDGLHFGVELCLHILQFIHHVLLQDFSKMPLCSGVNRPGWNGLHGRHVSRVYYDKQQQQQQQQQEQQVVAAATATDGSIAQVATATTTATGSSNTAAIVTYLSFG